ncbi:hypothetical protein PMIT1313_00680 [Prochlorococcus marinus str. MIT 1313]|uniref:hypothetical protein n=1 Tax=Prochlorococcus TaxID=1218 RepID=UPI0007B3CBCF|nr:hypothetical protein [Prochlorococcus marinus]KZR70034.1 hypothetical protein PMIT1313_00680 [Prochlorococcus marinus str. MIT 1313]KZR72758.1 hypothetical protein PMIT1318_00720 [Prochlorococcus marinus str. MIT 1318]
MKFLQKYKDLNSHIMKPDNRKITRGYLDKQKTKLSWLKTVSEITSNLDLKHHSKRSIKRDYGYQSRAPMKNHSIHPTRKYLLKRVSANGEEGLAMVLALLMGTTLIIGASGLLIRQLMARKLGSSESYQQMAEAASVNGFNRILSVLNNNDPSKYRGYLYNLVNNEDEDFNWELDPSSRTQLLEQICTDTSKGLPILTDGAQWPTGHTKADDSTSKTALPFTVKGADPRTEREDGRGNIQSYYRLRSYSVNFASGVGEGVAEIEGMVKREEAENDDLLGRALLIRSFYVKSKMKSDNDWGVIAAKHLDLGPTQITGGGKILWHINEDEAAEILKADRSGCKDDLLSRINGTTSSNTNRIWPVLGRDKQSSLSAILFGDNRNNKNNIDYYPGSSNVERVWSFDDTKNQQDDTKNQQGEFYCGEEEIVCTRAKNTGDQTAPDIEITSESIRKDPANGDQTSNTQTRQKDRSGQQDSTGEPVLASAEGISKSYLQIYPPYSTYKANIDKFNLYCYGANCFERDLSKSHSRGAGWKRLIREGGRKQTWEFSEKDYFKRFNAWAVTKRVQKDEIKSWTVRIKQNDICKEQSNQNTACHMYIEHMNLENTKILIENDKRPVVLHLELPPKDSKHVTGLSSGRIELSNNSLLCGVNSGETKCNNKPERFIINQVIGQVIGNENKSSKCDLNQLKGAQQNRAQLQPIVSIEGTSLPAAWVYLQTGTFTLSGDAQLTGVIWANSFCSQNNQLSLSTRRVDGGEGSIVKAADELWRWSENGVLDGNYGMLGRTVTRGIRGSGLDMFRRW